MVDVTFSGVCMDQITVEFPKYPIKGKIEDDLISCFRDQGNNPKKLPKLPEFCGDHIELLPKYLYFTFKILT